MQTIPAPFEVSLRVLPEWIDVNGHLHDANYVDAFNEGFRKFFGLLGIGSAHRDRGHMVFNLGLNIDYLKELYVDEPIRLTMQIVDWDYKRLHIYTEMFHGDTGVLCATAERLFMNISIETRRSTPFFPDVYERIEAAGKAHAVLGRPERLGRLLGIRRDSRAKAIDSSFAS